MPKRLNLVGQKFGYLIVVKDIINSKKGRSQFLCRCGCGNEIVVFSANLKSGHTQSCGCLQRKRASEARRSDLVGKKFGRLIVLEDVGNNKGGRSQWVCRCDCGNETIVIGSSLKNGSTKSCGCLHKEKVVEYNKNRIISEETKKKISGSLKGRCGKKGKDSPSYKHGLAGTRSYKNQMNSKRKARKRNQTPRNADLKKIQLLYSFCEMLNQTLEENYEVDHIVPLSKGGLHHQDNLQILLKSLNSEKSTKWPLTKEEEMRYTGIVL